MKRLRLGAAAAALGAAALLALPGTAMAASDDLSIVKTSTDNGQVQAVVQLNASASPDDVDLSSAAMTFDGQSLDTSARALGTTDTFTQEAMLAIDTSGSMRGDRIDGAKAAARSFLSAVPPQVKVGLITFANKAVVAVAPTTDRSQVLSAVNGLSASGSTALYDAVALASAQVRAADVGTVLVLSDGENEGGSTTLASATKSAKDSGATFDAVSIGTGAQVASLRAITGATGGQVNTSAADATQLSAAFDKTAQTINNQLLVTGSLPGDETAASGNITVAVDVGNTTYSDVAFVQLAKEPAPAPSGSVAPEAVAAPGPLVTFASHALWPALLALFIGLVVILVFAITRATDPDRGTGRMRSRLSIYTLTGRAPVKEQETTALGDSQVARSAVELANRVVAKRDLESVVGEQLESAGVPLKAGEWTLIHVGIGIGAGLLFFLVFGGAIIPTLLGLALGLIGPWMYLSTKRKRRLKKFMEQLPDTLQLMAGSLAAGYSMPQAADTVVREAEAPMASEFNRALVETRLGVPLEDALDGIATRMRSVDFSWVVMAIKIQREVGGNLAEVLNTVAATLRERERLRRQVDVLSAEGRLSAWILGLLPFAFALYLVLARPQYLLPLVENPLGWALDIMAVVLMIVGVFWLRKVVKVEV